MPTPRFPLPHPTHPILVLQIARNNSHLGIFYAPEEYYVFITMYLEPTGKGLVVSRRLKHDVNLLASPAAAAVTRVTQGASNESTISPEVLQ